MDDAVALTLQRNPAVRIARESVDIGEGRLRASSGAFDWLVRQFKRKADASR